LKHESKPLNKNFNSKDSEKIILNDFYLSDENERKTDNLTKLKNDVLESSKYLGSIQYIIIL